MGEVESLSTTRGLVGDYSPPLFLLLLQTLLAGTMLLRSYHHPRLSLHKPHTGLPVFFLDSWLLKMGQIGCPETLVWNYHYLLHSSPEENNSHLLCKRSLKSCTIQDEAETVGRTSRGQANSWKQSLLAWLHTGLLFCSGGTGNDLGVHIDETRKSQLTYQSCVYHHLLVLLSAAQTSLLQARHQTSHLWHLVGFQQLPFFCYCQWKICRHCSAYQDPHIYCPPVGMLPCGPGSYTYKIQKLSLITLHIKILQTFSNHCYATLHLQDTQNITS